MKKYVWLVAMAAGVVAVSACDKKQPADAEVSTTQTVKTEQVAAEAEAAAQEVTAAAQEMAQEATATTDGEVAVDANSAEAKAGEDQQY